MDRKLSGKIFPPLFSHGILTDNVISIPVMLLGRFWPRTFGAQTPDGQIQVMSVLACPFASGMKNTRMPGGLCLNFLNNGV